MIGITPLIRRIVKYNDNYFSQDQKFTCNKTTACNVTETLKKTISISIKKYDTKYKFLSKGILISPDSQCRAMMVDEILSNNYFKDMQMTSFLIMSCMSIYFYGRYLYNKKNGHVNGKQEEKLSKSQAQHTNTVKITNVPHAKEVWLKIAKEIENEEIENKEVEKVAVVKGSKIKNHDFSHFNGRMILGIQGLQPAVRLQLLKISYFELRAQIEKMNEEFNLSNENEFQNEIAKIFITCCSDITEKWLGYKTENRNLEIAVKKLINPEYKDSKMENNGAFDEYEGLWNIIREKLPLHSLIIRYMRFGPDSLIPLQQQNNKNANNFNQSYQISNFKHNILNTSFTFNKQSITSLVIMSNHVIQDMLLCISEVVVMEYLSEIRNGPRNTMDIQQWPTTLQSYIHNTRTLEKYRNQIYLGWWYYLNINSVIAIFEDYHLLWGFQSGGKLLQRKIYARRSNELKNLKKWRLLFSYILEAMDTVEPIILSFIKKISDLISFLLVTLIGRALGLIYRGIRNSLRNNPDDFNVKFT